MSAFLSRMMTDEMSVAHVFATALAVSVAGTLMIALVASTGPARRALKVDPTEALREG